MRRCAPPVSGPYNCQDDCIPLCILYERLQVRLEGHFCAVHAVADMLRSVCLTCIVLRRASPLKRPRSASRRRNLLPLQPRAPVGRVRVVPVSVCETVLVNDSEEGLNKVHNTNTV